MRQLYAGFSRVDITPPLGIPVAGYFVSRFADGVLDPLNLRALALQVGENKVVLLSAELVGLRMEMTSEIQQMISDATGLPVEAIYIHCSHTHTGPEARTGLVPLSDDVNALKEKYIEQLYRKCVDVSLLALDDLKPAKMGYGAQGCFPMMECYKEGGYEVGSSDFRAGVAEQIVEEGQALLAELRKE